MQDDEATLDGQSAASVRPPESDRFARPRIRLATPDETRAYAPPAPDDGPNEGEYPVLSHADADADAFELEVAPPTPTSDVYLLQDWVTIAGRAGALVAQDEIDYFDFSEYQDAAFSLEIAQFTTDQAFALETSPVKMDAWFRSMSTIGLTATGVVTRVVRWATSTLPPARWLRWRTGNLFTDWSVTFRLFVRGLRAVRSFSTQPPDWITRGAPRPFREVVRIVRSPLDTNDERPIPADGEQWIHYTGPDGSDLAESVRRRTVGHGGWQ